MANTPLPVVPKGVMTSEDARAVRAVAEQRESLAAFHGP